MSSTTTSDYEMSEDCSNSPVSYTVLESPHSSPSQNVLQITNCINEMTCSENVMFIGNGLRPELRIIEQPQSHFRFRYVSEMIGTHGCLLGKSNNSKKTKTHPTVELVNYSGRGVIKCSLAQWDRPAEHPHRLLEDEQDREVSHDVPENGSYTVAFAGMGIIHTAKKDVSRLLYNKFAEQLTVNNKAFDAKLLKAECDLKARNIDLNIVRLKFTAHDKETGRLLCEPVYSDNIYNMKSAATNDLRICRISTCHGRPSGGEEVFILVEKVNKKKIEIRFYELNKAGERVWEARGKFSESDVHHQYAIVFSTPAYVNPKTIENVNVFIELYRTSDGRTSEPVPFIYKADKVYRQMNRKNNMNSPYSSLESSSSGSITNLLTSRIPFDNDHEMTALPELTVPTLSNGVGVGVGAECGLGSALGGVGVAGAGGALWAGGALGAGPSDSSLPHITLHSKELDNIPPFDTKISFALSEDDYSRYAEFFPSFNDMKTEDSMPQMHQTIAFEGVPDSGRIKEELDRNEPEQSTSMETKADVTDSEYPAVYKLEEGIEVKKLVKEICDLIRSKKGFKNDEVRRKFERLFEIRLSNGDTFLHMALCSEEPTFESIVKVIHGVKMTHLLNYSNHKQKTILHLAITHGTPKLIKFLVSKGCDPTLKDSDEENAIHYAVKYRPECLEPLLEAIDAYKVPCDLNECNGEGLSALHLCVLYGRARCVGGLVARGARTAQRAPHARTALHLAARNHTQHTLGELLAHMPQSEVDLTDELDNTALQIICGSALNEHSVEMVKLLLEHKADPLKHVGNTKSAWHLCRDKPPLRDVMREYVPPTVAAEEDVKSEPEDEYESADEELEYDEPTGAVTLVGLSAYMSGVCAAVEGAQRGDELAARLAAHAHTHTHAHNTRELLMHLQETGADITSKSLALILEDMGLFDAAKLIRSCID